MRKNAPKHILLITGFTFLLVQGCNSLQARQFVVDANRSEDGARFYENLDAAIRESGVRDASVIRVARFPYLRADRFLIAMKGQLTDEARKELWVRRMADLDLATREKEIQNLPMESFRELAARLDITPDKNTLTARLKEYSRNLLSSDKKEPNFYKTLGAAVRDPGEYSELMRAAGLYPLFYLPIVYATDKAYNEFQKWHTTPAAELPVKGQLVRYVPGVKTPLLPEEIARMFSARNRDAFGVPELTENDKEKLAAFWAPIFVQDVVDSYDRFGEIRWQDNRVVIAKDSPAAYYYFSETFIQGKPALQVNYTIWYSGRLGPDAPWIERGPLDGLTTRVTLDNNGHAVMADIMNNCGCYYFFVPRRERVKKVIAKPFALDPFVPAWLPDDVPARSLTLRINTGWHQIQNISSYSKPTGRGPGTENYRLLPYHILEALPHPGGGTESVFDSNGIMKDSKRIEPYIFFSTGIHSIGYMRQRGHHAIKLIGKDHFTDPRLFDKNFIFR